MKYIEFLKKNLSLVFSSHKIWFYIIMIFFGSLFLTIVVSNHYLFRTTAFDYGVYNFTYWDYAHLHNNIVPCIRVFGVEKTLLQDHFSLMLIYLVPVYWLIGWLTGSYTLLLIEVVLIMWSGWAVYKLIQLKTQNSWLGVSAVLYYFILQGRFSAFVADANILTMASCLVPLFIYYFELKKYKVAAIIFAFAMLAREDMPLWFAFIFFVLLLWHRKEKAIAYKCLGYVGICIVYFIIVFKVFIPVVATKNVHYNLFNYSALGYSPFSAFKNIILHPLKALQLFYINQTGLDCYGGIKREFYLVYLISGGFILFLRPQYFIWFIPIVVQKVFNDDPVRWGIVDYYPITVVTMLPISVFLIIPVLKKRKLQYVVSIIVCLATGITTMIKIQTQNQDFPWYDTLKGNITDTRFFDPPYSVREIRSALKLIPADAKVCASASILSHLSQRRFVYEFPDVGDAEYLAVFTNRDFYLLTDSAYRAEVDKYLRNPDWDVIASSHKFVLFKKQPNHINQADIIVCDTIKPGIDSMAKNLFNPSLNLLLDDYPRMYFSKEPNKYKHITHFACNAEKTNSAADSVMVSDGSRVEVGGYVTTEKPHLDKHSIRIRFSRPFGLITNDMQVRPQDIVMVSVWRNSMTGEGVPAIQMGRESKVAVYGKAIGQKDTNGWQLTTASAFIKKGTSNVFFYVWDNGSKPVYIDDMDVYIYRW